MLGRLKQPFPKGNSKQLGDRMRIELAHQAGAVLVDRTRADPKVFGLLRVGFTASDAEQDLPFTRSQFRLGFAPCKKHFDRRRKDSLTGMDSVQAGGQHSHILRFEENTRSAAVTRVGKDGRAFKTSHDDNSCLRAPAPRFLDDFDPGHRRHCNIKQHDVGPVHFYRRNGIEPVVDFSNDFEPAGSFKRQPRPHSDDFVIIANNDTNCLHSKAFPLRLWFYIISLLVLAFVSVAPSIATAQLPAAIELAPERGAQNISPHIFYFLEDEARPMTLAQARELWESGKFSPVERIEPSFGYREGGIWLRFNVRNTSDEEQARIIHMGTNFMLNMDVFADQGGNVQQLLSMGSRSSFSQRPVDYHELAVPAVFPARSDTIVWVHYRSGGATTLPINLDTNTEFVGRVSAKLTKDFVFYGIMVMFILVGAGATIISSTKLFGSYCLYVASVLLYLFQRDGYGFQYLWPNAPTWNSVSSLPLGALMAIMAANFALVYLGKRRAGPIMRYLLFAIMAAHVAEIAAMAFVELRVLKQAAVNTMTASILVFLLIGIQSWIKEGRQLLFFVIGWFGVVVASFSMFAFHTLGFEISREQNLDTMRAAIVFDAFMMGIASITGLLMQQRERAALLREREASMTATVELQTRLNRLEKRAQLATAIALSSSRKMANTAHDLRQPLYALREMIADLLANATPRPDRSRQIEQSLSFMEELVTSTLDRATSEEAVEETCQETAHQAVMSTGRILEAIEAMFAEDAKNRGSDLQIEQSDAPLQGDPVAILRILANFVSNAVRYAPGATITVRVKHSPHGQVFEVLDTGPGMSPQALALCKERHETKGNEPGNSESHGLGLSIVDELTRTSGFNWSIDSLVGLGTTAVLEIPHRPPFGSTNEAGYAVVCDADHT